MPRGADDERMDPMDPNIKARFNNRQELYEFLDHYALPFPLEIHIWHGEPRSLWLVAPERNDRERTKRHGTHRSSAGATMPACGRAHKVRDHWGTRPNDAVPS